RINICWYRCDLLFIQRKESFETYIIYGISELSAGAGRSNHSDKDGLPVRQTAIAGHLLQRMAKGMSKIKVCSLAGFVYICFHNVCFYACALSNNFSPFFIGLQWFLH